MLPDLSTPHFSQGTLTTPQTCQHSLEPEHCSGLAVLPARGIAGLPTAFLETPSSLPPDCLWH